MQHVHASEDAYDTMRAASLFPRPCTKVLPFLEQSGVTWAKTQTGECVLKPQILKSVLHYLEAEIPLKRTSFSGSLCHFADGWAEGPGATAGPCQAACLQSERCLRHCQQLPKISKAHARSCQPRLATVANVSKGGDHLMATFAAEARKALPPPNSPQCMIRKFSEGASAQRDRGITDSMFAVRTARHLQGS